MRNILLFVVFAALVVVIVWALMSRKPDPRILTINAAPANAGYLVEYYIDDSNRGKLLLLKLETWRGTWWFRDNVKDRYGLSVVRDGSDNIIQIALVGGSGEVYDTWAIQPGKTTFQRVQP